MRPKTFPLANLTTSLLRLTWLGAFFLMTPFVAPSGAQLHPPEVRFVYPLAGSPGTTARVTVSGVSFRNASQILFDKPGITAKVVGPDFSKLPAPTHENDQSTEVIAEFTVAKDALPGLYQFRILSAAGLSNLGKWLVGRDVPTMEEKEPNNKPEQAQAVPLPVAVNGRIGEVGDEDCFAFDLEAGKTFVARVTAASVDSALDSLLTLRDAAGREVMSNDDFNGADSLLIYPVKQAGHYTLTLSSGVGQGGPTHAYYLSMGCLPVVMAVYPASVERNKTTEILPIGYNLPEGAKVEWKAGEAAPAGVKLLQWPTPAGMTNPQPLFVTDLPTITAQEANFDQARATSLPAPGIANGRFLRADGKPGGDVAFYKFRAEAGKRYLFDLQCAAIGSRADPDLTLLDSAGKPIEENDDFNGRDSHLDRTFDKAGEYLLRVKEMRGRTGADLVYRLVIQSPPPPGFSLSMETGARAVGRGDSVPYIVSVDRDRWDGPVTLTPADLPAGVTANTCLVPAGVGKGLIVLTADANAPMTAFPLHIVGTAQVNGKMVSQMLERAVDWFWKGGGRQNSPIPANMIQCAVSAPFEVAVKTDMKEITLMRGQSLKIKVKIERRLPYKRPMQLRLLNLPPGVEAAEVTLPPEKNEAELELKAKPDARLGMMPIALEGVVSNGMYLGGENVPLVQLERSTPPLTLTVSDPPKK